MRATSLNVVQVELCVERAGAGDFSKLHVTEALPLISDTQRIVKRAYMRYFPRFKAFLIRNCEIRLEALFYLSVRSFTLPHGETRLSSDGFALNFVLDV